MFMKAFPQFTKDTELSIIETEAKTFRILLDGKVHPLYVGFTNMESTRLILECLCSASTVAGFSSGKETMLQELNQTNPKVLWGKYYDPEIVEAVFRKATNMARILATSFKNESVGSPLVYKSRYTPGAKGD